MWSERMKRMNSTLPRSGQPAGSSAGWRGVRGVWPALLVCGGSFALVQFLVSNLHGPWLVDVLGGLVSLRAHLVENRAADGAAGAVLTGDAAVDVQDGHYCLLGMDLLPRHPK